MCDREPFHVRAQGVEDDVGDGHGPDAGLGLGRSELHRLSCLLEELTVDGQSSSALIDPVDGETEDLAPAKPRLGGDCDDRSRSLR